MNFVINDARLLPTRNVLGAPEVMLTLPFGVKLWCIEEFVLWVSACCEEIFIEGKNSSFSCPACKKEFFWKAKLDHGYHLLQDLPLPVEVAESLLANHYAPLQAAFFAQVLLDLLPAIASIAAEAETVAGSTGNAVEAQEYFSERWAKLCQNHPWLP